MNGSLSYTFMLWATLKTETIYQWRWDVDEGFWWAVIAALTCLHLSLAWQRANSLIWFIKVLINALEHNPDSHSGYKKSRDGKEMNEQRFQKVTAHTVLLVIFSKLCVVHRQDYKTLVLSSWFSFFEAIFTLPEWMLLLCLLFETCHMDKRNRQENKCKWKSPCIENFHYHYFMTIIVESQLFSVGNT